MVLIVKCYFICFARKQKNIWFEKVSQKWHTHTSKPEYLFRMNLFYKTAMFNNCVYFLIISQAMWQLNKDKATSYALARISESILFFFSKNLLVLLDKYVNLLLLKLSNKNLHYVQFSINKYFVSTDISQENGVMALGRYK